MTLREAIAAVDAQTSRLRLRVQPGARRPGLELDPSRGLKLRVPKPGLRIKLIPTPGEIEECQTFGRELGEELMGRRGPRVIDMSEIIHSTHH